MPALIPAILPIIGLVAGGATAASSIYGMTQGRPSMPPGPTPTQLTNQAVAAETSNRANATREASQILPTLQAETSGGLSPEAYRDLSANFSGNANFENTPQMQQMVARFLGLDTGQFGGSNTFGVGSSINAPGLAG